MTSLEEISQDNISGLAAVYKEVFSGAPWYEERICSGANSQGKDRCTVQYTSRTLPLDYAWKLDKQKRTGVLGKARGIDKCVACDRGLIGFYPDFINQSVLIEEAMREKQFSGFLLKDEMGQPFGFSWGYNAPKNRTPSVNFPLVNPLLDSNGINPEKTFYWAELGIVDKMQGRGLGLLASAAQLESANSANYQNMALRTKNERVLSISERLFSGRKAKSLFQDPEKGTPWYCWNFRDFDLKEVAKILEKLR